MFRPARNGRWLLLATVGAVLLQGCRPTMSDIDISIADVPAPQILRANFRAGSHFNGPVDRLAWKKPTSERRPLVIVVAGCAFSVHGSEFPSDAITLSVDESPDEMDEPTLTEACLAHDDAAIRAAVQRQIAFILSRLPTVEIGDPDRVMLYASEDAVPEAARFHGRFVGKLLLGGPCDARWPDDLDDTTPTTLVIPRTGAGARWVSDEARLTPRDLEGSDREVERKVRSRMSTSTVVCEPISPPPMPKNITVRRSPGRAGYLLRSEELAAMERQIADDYLNASAIGG